MVPHYRGDLRQSLKGYLGDELLIEYTTERPLAGYVGLWTKADSVTYFHALTIEAGGKKRRWDVGKNGSRIATED